MTEKISHGEKETFDFAFDMAKKAFGGECYYAFGANSERAKPCFQGLCRGTGNKRRNHKPHVYDNERVRGRKINSLPR